MARTNSKPATIHTHEGAVASHINAKLQLRRSVMACLLWEDSFYESGQSIVDRISSTIPQVDPVTVAMLAVEAREQMKLRHVPLLIVREMAKLTTHKHLVSSTLERVIRRADELAEFVALYWKSGRQPLSAQVKKGLAAAFGKFSEYDLAKYNRDKAVKLRDVLFLCHAKPKDEEQAAVWKRLVEGKLAIPDTWEVALSAGADKKATWERLIAERKLGALAFLRNLRNMAQVGVSLELVKQGLSALRTDTVLPFRFISAAKYNPALEPELEQFMFKCLEGRKKLPGKTALVIDGSGSMFGASISAKSEIDRFEAAAALAILAREVCESVSIVVFSDGAGIVPPRSGFALRDTLFNAAGRGGTNTRAGLEAAASQGYDRLILITDEQSHTSVRNPLPGRPAYIINVACYKNGIGYGDFTHIDGWSEAVLDYIAADDEDIRGANEA